MKPAVKLWDVIKPPFVPYGFPTYIADQNTRLCGEVRGWGIFQHYENGSDLQHELHQFMVDAMNEKYERMKEAEHERV
jgi:hypothetical protein